MQWFRRFFRLLDPKPEPRPAGRGLQFSAGDVIAALDRLTGQVRALAGEVGQLRQAVGEAADPYPDFETDQTPAEMPEF
jgi:hypothetical protein